MKKPVVACYYFPGYHPTDPRNALIHGPGWSEWEMVRRAEPRFPGHRQPRCPAWGEENEADPRVMERKIRIAAEHGVDAFLYDWYWYDDGPFLQNGLDQGFLGASNRGRVRFALMWANHDWTDIHPYKRSSKPALLYPGCVTPATFESVTRHVIEAYFGQESYLTIDGRPYFSFYEIGTLVRSFGSVPAARAALDAFRARGRAAGFPGLHLNAVMWGSPILPGETAPARPAELVKALGFDSVTSYVWVHHWAPGAGPTIPYETVLAQYLAYWDKVHGEFGVPYFPNVTMGWDSSPRTVMSDMWGPSLGYPFTPVITGNTPEAFRHALQETRARLARCGDPAVVTVNAWNEWTEGSYLEPDTEFGLGYLEAIRAVFGQGGKGG